MSSQAKRGFTLIELLVVIAIIAILASILFPVFAKAREKARQTTCTSQVRQLATAVQMYVQDNNGKFPGVTLAGTYTGSASDITESWNSKLDTYVGNQKMFHCPSDANTEEAAISYAYNGLLVKLNGDGVAESQISAPTDVGAVADADPSSQEGGLLGGGCNLSTASPYFKSASPRHGGVIIGYCDGHAKYAPGKTINEKDSSNPVTRAFYMATSLGLVDNPGGGINDTLPTVSTPGTITIGGDYCTRPILLAAAELWKKSGGTYTMAPFAGLSADSSASGRTVYGSGSNTLTTSAIAYDAMVVIVAKSTKLTRINGTAFGKGSPNLTSDYYATTAQIREFYATDQGASAGKWQTYTLRKTDGSRTFFEGQVVSTSGTATINVANDLEMVEKVAADPYGIGYCSAAFADLDRVTILGVQVGASPDETKDFYPNGTKLSRTIVPDTAPTGVSQGAFWRTLRVQYAGGSEAHKFYAAYWSSNKPGTTLAGAPLFKASYYAQ